MELEQDANIWTKLSLPTLSINHNTLKLIPEFRNE
jgi:hypothetical protein